MTHEEKIHELKEALVKKQDKNASFEVDLTRSRQEFRELFSSFIIADKRSAKFFNSIVFTESDDSTFEDWYFNMMNKFRTNENHFDSKQIKTVYVIQRTDDEAVKHVNAYRIVNASYFIIFEIMFQVLKEIYEDTDKFRKIKQEYLNLKQDLKEKFVSFYNKLICNGRLLKYFNRMLMNDLILKWNKGFRSALVNNSRCFELIVQMKNHLILIDNARRQIQVKVDRKIAVKKVVEFFKPFSSNRNQFYFRQIIIVTRITQSIAITSTFTIEAKIEKKNRMNNNCFICHQSRHLARDCSEQIIKDEIMIKKLMIDRGTLSSYHSDSEN